MITRTRRVLLAAFAGVLLLSGCGFSLQNSDIGRTVDGPSYDLVVEFSDVSGLPLGGKVRLGPTTVGRVYSVETKDFVALVTVKMRDDVRLPKGTKAGLELSTALGDQFIALKAPSKPGAEMIEPGGRIALTDTLRGPDIEDTMALLGSVLNNSGIDQARVIVTELNTMLDGREEKARALLGRADRVLDALEQRTGDFNATLRSINQLTQTVTRNRKTLEEGLIKIKPAMDLLAGQQGDFTKLLRSVSTLSTEVDGALQKSQASLRRTLVKLGPIVEALAAVDGELGDTLHKFAIFSKLFQRAAPGDYVNLDGTANIPDSITGVLEGGQDQLGDLLDNLPLSGGGSTEGGGRR